MILLIEILNSHCQASWYEICLIFDGTDGTDGTNGTDGTDGTDRIICILSCFLHERDYVL